MKNSEIAKVFEDIADLLELKGENPFKIRAYQKVVRSIEHLPVEVEQLVAENRLQAVPGVGEAITKKITELVTTGKLGYYENLKAEFPEGISTLLDIPSIGPKTAMLLSTELDITSIDELEAAIVNGQVATLPRLGDKIAENILLTSKLELFSNLQSLKEIDVRWDTIFSSKISKYIDVNFNVQLFYDRDISHKRQLKQALSIGLTYTFLQ